MLESLTMLSIENWCSQNQGIIGALLGMIGIALAIIFYYKGKRIKDPVYALTSVNVINGYTNSIKNLNISYSGHPVEDLTVSKIALWNSGRETIRGSDIAANDLLRIEIESGLKILDVHIVAEVRGAIATKFTKISDNLVNLNFDFLDFNDGFLVQIIHTGTRSDDLSIRGSLIGVNKITKKDIGVVMPFQFAKISSKRLLHKKKNVRFVAGLVALFSAIVLGYGFIFAETEARRTYDPNILRVMCFISFFLYLQWAYSMLKRHMPKELDDKFH